MPKANTQLSREDINVFLDHISNKSKNYGSGVMPGYIRGYLISTFEQFASVSPAIKKILQYDVEKIRSGNLT